MLGTRLTQLWPFAVGCLSGAVLIGFWRGDAESARFSMPEGALVRTAEASVPATVTASAVQESASSKDAPVAPTAEPARSSNDASDTGAVAPAEPGSSVADVLIGLEAAYRRGLAVAPVDAPATAGDAVTPTASDQSAAAASIAPPVSTAVAEAPSREVPARAETAVALVAPVAPPPSAPALETAQNAAPAAAPRTTPAAPERVLAVREEPPPRVIYVGDVQQNTYVGDVQQNTYLGEVHQGDVYLLQQQLALLQYLQLLGLSASPQLTSPAHRPRDARTHRGMVTRRPSSFSFPLTDPNNPWGFDFPPTVLVK